MLTADTQLVSVDDHIVEHPNVWTDRLPAKHQEAGPRIVDQDTKKVLDIGVPFVAICE